MKIGILLPSSRLYPALSFDFLGAYLACLKDKSRSDITYAVEQINTGGDYKLLQQKTQGFLLNPEIKIILAFIDPYAAKQIEPFANAAGKILITCEAGSVVPGIEIPSPNHMAFSLQGAYGSYLSAVHAIGQEHKRSLYVTSFYDGGYPHTFAACQVFKKQNLELLDFYVTPFARQEIELHSLNERIVELKPDALILQHSAENGTLFLEKCREAQIPSSLPVYASSFMLEEEWIQQQAYYFEQVTGFVAWHSSLDTPANNHFKSTILAECDKPANIFHVLGWESAMLIERIATLAAGVKKPALQLLQEASEQPFVSPRGQLCWNKEFRHFVGPMYGLRLVRNGEVYKTEVTGAPHIDIPEWSRFAADIPEGVLSRWLNTYLCPT